MAELVEQRDDFVVGEQRRLAARRGGGEVAGQVGDRVLHAAAPCAGGRGVVHPRAAALAGARVEIEVELADQRAARVDDVEEAHVRVPRRRLRFGGSSRSKSVSTTRNRPSSTLVLGEVLLHLLVGKRVARVRAAFPTHTRGPRLRARRGRVARAANSPQLRPCRARRTAARACARSSQEADAPLRRLRHLRHQRHFGEVRDSRAAALLRGAAAGFR